ncbi:alpha-methylacyl-CoA racemase [Stomoxys calcitrans]|uniref:alpha-methylacyl-CoA racemase n=1 Tax=Stomoxys calcitrans TaxID=35570 RepID=UPI0027E233ED|nr:alpha-methylacyl-CoA racemase [Stomoxys calcitrans]
MPLKGIKVLEFAGLAPAPFCGKILADFGAKVTVIDRVPDNSLNCLNGGKRVLAINLKRPEGQNLVRKLAGTHDVILEPFRPGIMEKMNLGPDVLCKDNPRLIYARLTGFGQEGRLAPRAGHDINYAAISGVLSMLGRKNEKPLPPINLLADFAGGGLMCAFGICLALLERHRSGRGQIVDSAMVDGAAYVASWLFMGRKMATLWQGERGTNLLDGGYYFYDTYETKDGKYMSVGALEPQFFEEFKNKLGLPQLSQFVSEDSEKEAAKALVTKTFLQKTQDEWTAIFEDIDACVYPVLDWSEVMQHDHNKCRKAFAPFDEDNSLAPQPAPRLSRTPGVLSKDSSNSPEAFEEAIKMVRELNLSNDELKSLVNEKILILPAHAKL